jgi:ATP-dependent DNA helicase RecG
MYSDRVEIISPGGLFGPVSLNNLETAQASRNQLLVRLLGEVGLVENRGSGIRAMVSAMREAHLEPPKFEDHRDFFKVVFSNQALLDPESLAWLNQFAGTALNSRQRTALVYQRKHGQITNSEYCRLNNVDSVTATKDLKGLVDSGMVEMHGTRRWAYYHLTVKQEKSATLFDADLTPRQKVILEYIKEHGSITTAIYVQISEGKIAERTARKDLQDLENKGIIQQKGQKRGAYYIIKNAE